MPSKPTSIEKGLPRRPTAQTLREQRAEQAVRARGQRKALERTSEFRNAWRNKTHPRRRALEQRWAALQAIEAAHPAYTEDMIGGDGLTWKEATGEGSESDEA